MRLRILVSVVSVFVFVFLTASPGFAQQSAELLFQSGLYQEEVEGNLTKAIEVYEQILKNFPGNRSVAAKAQLQIGICYEKLGAANAEDAYRKVIAEFADQPAVVSVARQRLNLLRKSYLPTGGKDALTIRRVSYPRGAISPDGKYIAHEDWKTMESLIVHDLKTGKERSIIDAPKNKGCFFFLVGWAPSSRRILYEMATTDLNTSELRIVDLDGKNSRVLYRFKDHVLMAIGVFSPDESAVYVLVRSGDWEYFAIGRVDVESGRYTEIKNLGKVYAANLAVSPDGKFLAYTLSPYRYAVDSDIQILKSDGTDESPLISGPSIDRLLGWMPDNRGIVFYSTRSGELAIWSLAVIQGKADGLPVHIRSIKGSIEPSGFTRNGAFYFLEWSQGNDVYFAPIDFDSGKRLSDPQRVEPVFSGRSRNSFWSADGKFLAYVFSTSQDTDPLCQYLLKIRNLETGKTRDILLGFKPSEYSISSPWSVDGKSIFLKGSIQENRGGNKRTSGLWHIDVSSGEVKMIFESRNLAAWSSDGRVVYEYFSSSRDRRKGESWVERKDLMTGEKREIYRGKPRESIYGASLSPDEKIFAFRTFDLRDMEKTGRLVLIPESGGQEISSFRNRFPEGTEFFSWAPKSKGGLVGLKSSADLEKVELWYYPPGETTASRKLEFVDQNARIMFSPDGKYISYTAALESESNFWAVENYLPAKK
jgi:Tol biopolymer transport system component